MAKWSREECIVALRAYTDLKDDTGRFSHARFPELIRAPEYAELLESRGMRSIRLRLDNYKSLNGEYEGKGLSHISCTAEGVWNEFHDDSEKLRTAAEVARMIPRYQKETGSEDAVQEGACGDPADRAGLETAERIASAGMTEGRGCTGEVMCSVRVGQDMFRRRVMDNFDGKCCITGVGNKSLLRAGHIKPWSRCDGFEKVDFTNGLCLEPLMDLAYDRGLIRVDRNLTVRLSDRLVEYADHDTFETGFQPYEGERIADTRNGGIQTKYLRYHQRYVFKT